MMAERRQDSEEYAAATALARQVRERVAAQLAALVIDSDRMSGVGDFERRIGLVRGTRQRIASARAERQMRFEREMPLAPAVKAEAEAWQLLREALMNCAVACADWAAAIDYTLLQVRQNGASDV